MVEDKKLEGTKKKEINIFTASTRGLSLSAEKDVEEATKGSAATEDVDSLSSVYDDRAVKIEIGRTDEDCEWAYENDVSVFNGVERLDNLVNNGFDVFINKRFGDENNAELKKAKEFIEDKIEELRLTEKTSVIVKNKTIFPFSILKKTLSGTDIVGLVELDPKTCNPIRNLQTGELGGSAGKGVDKDNPDDEIALVQNGQVASYDTYGGAIYTDEYFYFKRDEIIPFTNNDRGKFAGTSAVKRILRLVEIKKSMENVVELIIRRFGPQVWIEVGNENVNPSNTEIPNEYLRDSDGNAVDRVTARKNYLNKLFVNIEDNVKKWIEGDSLAQIAEYGIKANVINPSSNLFDYARYIDLFANYIKVGILGLYIQGRIDITSAVMQEMVARDLKDKANKERISIEHRYNTELINPLLEANGYKKNTIYIKFKSFDKLEEEVIAEIERIKSIVVSNYLRAGLPDIPESVKKKLDITIGKINQKKDEEKDEEKKERELEKENDRLDRKTDEKRKEEEEKKKTDNKVKER